MNTQLKQYIFPAFVGFLIGVVLTSALAYVWKVKEHSRKFPVSTLFSKDDGFKFIKPSLFSQFTSQEDSLGWYPYEVDLKKEVQSIIDKNSDIEVGFYFHDLSNLSWFGINENQGFIPASLLKVPMAISYYKLHESNPNLFQEKILYQGMDYDKMQNINTPTNITPGNEYTVKQLLDEMIINSDNNALQLLYSYKKESLKQVFSDLQTPLPDNDIDIAQSDFLSTKDLGKFFLILYNSTYLNQKNSEELLELLSTTSYSDGLRAGVPSDVTVSHKFGERTLSVGDKTVKEFHDCGIVYLPGKPYKLCMMSKGDDLEKLQSVVREISKTVYDRMAAQKTTSQINKFITD